MEPIRIHESMNINKCVYSSVLLKYIHQYIRLPIKRILRAWQRSISMYSSNVNLSRKSFGVFIPLTTTLLIRYSTVHVLCELHTYTCSCFGSLQKHPNRYNLSWKWRLNYQYSSKYVVLLSLLRCSRYSWSVYRTWWNTYVWYQSYDDT